MATSYPGGLDSFPDLTELSYMDDTGAEADVLVTNIGDAISAIQAELGTDPSGSYSTVAERLNNASGGSVSIIEIQVFG